MAERFSGRRVRILGDPPWGGIIGTIRQGPDFIGRYGVVPDEPVYVKGKRGHARAMNPIWCMPDQLAPEPSSGEKP